MTTAQWMFEYHALRMKEEQEAETTHMVFESAVKIAKTMLVALLGLQPVKRADATDDESIIPLSYMCGNPNVMAQLFEESQNEEAAADAAGDDDFDAFSEQLMRQLQDGDMVPLLDDLDTDNLYVRSDAYRDAAAALGIRPRTSPEEALEIKRRPSVMLTDG